MIVLFYVMISISLCHITQMRKLRINQRGAGAGLALFTAMCRDVYSKCHMVFAMPLSWFYTRGYNVDVVLLFRRTRVTLRARWRVS